MPKDVHSLAKPASFGEAMPPQAAPTVAWDQVALPAADPGDPGVAAWVRHALPRLGPFWQALAQSLAGRPVRCLGADGRDISAGLPALLGVRRGSLDGAVCLVIDDEEGLLHALLRGAVEFHAAPHRLAADGRATRPDRFLLDLNPGSGTPWRHLLQAAALLRAMLAEAGLTAVLASDGRGGLQVTVPLDAQWTPAALCGVGEAVAALLCMRHPDRFALGADAGRVQVGWHRNRAGATALSVWSPVALPGHAACVPLPWNELCRRAGGLQWSVDSLRDQARSAVAERTWLSHGLPQTLEPLIQRLGLPV